LDRDLDLRYAYPAYLPGVFLRGSALLDISTLILAPWSSLSCACSRAFYTPSFLANLTNPNPLETLPGLISD
jgi:hypothetical protein